MAKAVPLHGEEARRVVLTAKLAIARARSQHARTKAQRADEMARAELYAARLAEMDATDAAEAVER